MRKGLAGWFLIAVSLLFFAIGLPAFQGAAAAGGNLIPGWPMGYVCIASVVLPLVAGVYLVFRKI